MKFVPLGERIVVEWNKPSEQSSGGIFMPAAAAEKPMTAIVVGVPPTDKWVGEGPLCPVKVGDTVVLPKYTGTEIKLDGRTLFVIQYDDILGVLAAD